jgi:hypothetical protein
LGSTTMVRRMVALGAVVASVAVAIPAAATPETPQTAAATAPAAQVEGEPGPFGKGEGQTLSPRLRTLAVGGAGLRNVEQQNSAAGLPSSGPGSLLYADRGRIVVEARLDSSDASVFDAIEALGAAVNGRDDESRAASIEVPVSRLRDLAAVPGVAWVQETLTPVVGPVRGVGDQPTSDEASDDAAAVGGPGTRASCSARVVSEGDAIHRAAAARSANGVDGAGVHVVILSDSFNRRRGQAADVAAGELPGSGNPCGRSRAVTVDRDYWTTAEHYDDRGRALAQVVHDLAPGARLTFSSALYGEQGASQLIRWFAQEGADIIVDDVAYFGEPVFQDGPIAAAVDDASRAGVAYFTAAGDGNVRVGGRDVGSYEAPAMRRSNCPARVAAESSTFRCHNFDTGSGVDVDNRITVAAGGSVAIKLGWNEPVNGVTTDMDLFLLDSSGRIVAAGADENSDSGRAVEVAGYTNPTSSAQQLRVVVARYGSGTSSPRFKLLTTSADVTAVEYASSAGGDIVGPTLVGHSASKFGASVAAVPSNSTATAASYSSRGPAAVCWKPFEGGTGIATRIPGGCETRTLAVAAVTDVRNSFWGRKVGTRFRYDGTSAAAAHAAAIGALQLQARPCASGIEVIAAQRASAVPVGGHSAAAVGGGLVDAAAAIEAMPVCLLPPKAPPGAYAEGDATGATVTWSPAAANGSPITAYEVVAHPTNDDYEYSKTRFPADATSGRITGLWNGRYRFRVRAVSEYGAGDLSGYTNTIDIGPIAEGTVFVPITPCRVLDTRRRYDKVLYAGDMSYIRVAGTDITGQGGRSSCIPAGAAAAEVSITALGGRGNGYLRAWAEGTRAPTATFLNFSDGAPATNTGTVPLRSIGGSLLLGSYGADRGYVVDVQGYYMKPSEAPEGSVYVPITPCRVLDTRRAGGALPPGATRNVQIAGDGIAGQGARSSCVPDGVTAVEASVSAVSPNANGFFRAWPRGRAAPTATFLNYARRAGTTNTGAIALAPTGTTDLTIGNYLGTSHYVIDIQGYFVPAAELPDGVVGARYVPIEPCRMLDTRRFGSGAPVAAGAISDVRIGGGVVTGQGAQPGCLPDAASAAEVSLSAVGPVGSGYVRAWPSDVDQPSATFLNFVDRRSTTNTGSVALAPDAPLDLSIGTFSGSTHLVLDVQGYFLPVP